MPTLETKLDRVASYLEVENARHDEKLRQRPNWWHAGKVLLGLAFLARGVSLALTAAGLARYALAALFLAGGAALAYEGAAMLRERFRG